MKQYLDLLNHILENGYEKKDRTGTGTIGVNGYLMRFPLKDGFPLMTTKKIHLKSIIYELLWMLSGDTNIKALQEKGVTIWDEWADANGELGRIYGAQWRRFAEQFNIIKGDKGVDQIAQLVFSLTNNPDSRRHIVTAWNPKELSNMALPPCHILFQCHTRLIDPIERTDICWKMGLEEEYRKVGPMKEEDWADWFDEMSVPKYHLDLELYQRSCDVFLGVPFNIASYSLLLLMLAQVTNMVPGEFIWVGGDVHIYKNHIDQVKLQLSRTPKPLPTMLLNPFVNDIFKFQFDDFQLSNYNPYPTIKADISI